MAAITFIDGGRLNKFPRLKEMSLKDRYYTCARNFYNISNVQAPLPSVSTSGHQPTKEIITTIRTSQVTPKTTSAPFWIYILIGGCLLFFLCFFCFCCCCCRERRKRQRTEKQVTQLMATTLTSLSESADAGSTYDDIPSGDLVNPTYNKTDIQLPIRKKHRLEGVSSTLKRTVKHLFTSDEDHPAINSGQSTLRRLPSIPETSKKSYNLSQVTHRHSIQNPEYEEIGPHLIFNSQNQNYSPSNAYEHLQKSNAMRKSMLLNKLSEIPEHEKYFLLEKANSDDNDRFNDEDGVDSGLESQTKKDVYFAIEKAGNTPCANKKTALTEMSKSSKIDSNGYFIIEKEENSNSTQTKNVREKSKPTPPPKPNETKHAKSELAFTQGNKHQKEMVNTENHEALSLVPNDTRGSKHDYFILEKSDCDSEEIVDDYLKPIDKQRHSYIDILVDKDIDRTTL